MDQYQNERHLKDYLRIFISRKWLIFCILYFTIYFVYIHTLTQNPVYRASSLLMVEVSNPNLSDFQLAYEPPLGNNEFSQRTFMETQCQLILCRPILEKTLNQFQKRKKLSFIEADNQLALFKKRFTVTPVRKTNLVRVAFDYENPKLASEILTYHVKVFCADYNKRHLGLSEDGLDKLEKKAADLKPLVEEKAKALQAFKVENNMVSFDKEQDIIVERMKKLNMQLTDAELERIQAESKYNTISNALKRKLPLEEMPEIIGSITIRDLKYEYIRAKENRSDLMSRFGPNHPEVKAASAQVESISDKITGEIQNILASAETEYKRALNQEIQLISSLNEQEEKVLQLNEKSAEYAILRDDYETINKTYGAIIQRIAEIEIGIAVGENNKDITIISKADIPTTPIKPRILFSMGLAAFAGLILSLALCFLLDYFDTSIKNKEDLAKVSKLPIIGYMPCIPKLKRKGKGFESRWMELACNPYINESLEEPLRSIRMSLSTKNDEEQIRTIVMTSALPNEGKTIIGLNVASSIARTGKSVLLIDADLRNRRLSEILAPGAVQGLSSLYLDNTKSVPDNILYSTPINNLFIVPSGITPPNPSSIIEDDRLKKMINEISAQFDYVFIDTPALIPSMDGAVLSGYAQGTILAVRAFSTDSKYVQRAQDRIIDSNGKPIGIILNQVDAPENESLNKHKYKASCDEHEIQYWQEKLHEKETLTEHDATDKAEEKRKENIEIT